MSRRVCSVRLRDGVEGIPSCLEAGPRGAEWRFAGFFFLAMTIYSDAEMVLENRERIAQPAEREPRRSSGELGRRIYENSVKFTRVAATNGILAANPSSFEMKRNRCSVQHHQSKGVRRNNVHA